MFFLYELERTITLHPSFLGPRIKEYLTNKLLEDVEGTCTGRYYIICVMDAFDISEGRIVPGSAVAEFTVQYRAVVWRPFKGETVDAIVESVNKMGFFANVGPLQIFVSSHLIPSDIKFDENATPPQYTDNGDQVIEKGTQIRIKLIGTRSDVGTLSETAQRKTQNVVRSEIGTVYLVQSKHQESMIMKALENGHGKVFKV